MITQFVFFPFDLFGSAGTASGAELLADEITEIMDDNARETVATRADAYAANVRIHEESFETQEAYRNWRERGREIARRQLRKNELLFWISGNHLGALPVYEEIARSKRRTLIIQLDAHLDVHDFDDCTKELSHGNFLLHADGKLPPIVNVGHRDQLLPSSRADQFFAQAISMVDWVARTSEALGQLTTHCQKADKIFIDLDCDVFDPTFFPAVKRPVPMGLSPQQVLTIIESVWSKKIAGVLISEFAPDCDREDRSLATLTWLIEHCLLRRYEG